MVQSENELEVVARRNDRLSRFRAAPGRPWEGPVPMSDVPHVITDPDFGPEVPFDPFGGSALRTERVEAGARPDRASFRPGAGGRSARGGKARRPVGGPGPRRKRQ
jgi:hypothetical protein